MKFFYKLFVFGIALYLPILIIAQNTVQIGSGTVVPASTLYGPLYRFSATSTTTGSRTNIVFTQAELTAAGIVNGSIISEVQFNKTNVANFVTPASSYKMYMANTTNTTLATTLTWASVLTTHTQVYTSSSFNLPSAAGWVSWAITPFTYTGGSLEIAFECTMGGNGAATDAFKWEYTDGLADKIVGVASSTGTTLNGTVAGYKHRPNIKIVFTSNACTTPPTPGTATSSITAACVGSNFSLGLTGNSFGQGQTYQWQSSPTGSAPWTDVGSAASSPSLTTSQSITNFYRCGITCSGNTQYSTSIQVSSPALVSGTFTINSGQPTSGTNFQTFTDAVNYIKCGINGPVTFNVLSGSGPYNEQVKLDSVFGTSATNTITINGNGTTLSFGSLTTTTTRHGIHLNGADYVRINNLIIDGTAAPTTTSAWGIVLTAQADNNIVSNCTINIGNLTSTSTNYIGIVLNGVATTTATSGNNGNGNLFLNNTINGGYYNYYLYGNSSSTAQNINNVIKGGTLQDAYLYSVYAAYQSTGLVVDSLDISRLTRATVSTAAGVFVTTGCVGALIQRNKIHNIFDAASTSTSTSYGIYIGTDATTANPTKVINNLIYNIGGNGTSYGIYNTGGDSMQVYNNTIALNDGVATTGTAYGIYQTTAATGIDVKNNIFYVTRSGTGIKRCIYFVTATTTFSSNNNVFYMNAGVELIIKWHSLEQQFIQHWQTGKHLIQMFMIN
jgi:hypothetical protein